MLIYKSRFLTRAEVWFDNETGDTRGVDWILFHQRSRPVPGARCRDFFTYLIDLTQPREELLARLNKDTAYKIRRARDKDQITCEVCDPNEPAVLDQFERMYNPFAAQKGLVPLDRPRLTRLAAVGGLDLSVAKDPQGTALVYHANVRNPIRASEMYLPSLYRDMADSAARNLIGRANRYLTWSDILRYQEQGMKYFDFGGWYCGSTDQPMLQINEFKRGFGGRIMREYQCEQILSLKGWLVLTVARVLSRGKAAPAQHLKQPAENSLNAEPQDSKVPASV